MKKIEVQDAEPNTASAEEHVDTFEEHAGESRVGDGVDDSDGADGQAAVPTPSEPEGFQQELTPSDEVSVLKDRLLRQAAEFQNYRRRVEQERQSDVKFGQSLVIQQLLDVYDDLRRSIEAAEETARGEQVDTEAAFDSLIGGVELVFKKFSDELQRFGVEPIEAVGSEFNEDEHEAMMQQPAPDGTAPGIVLAEIQKGFRMGDRVLRHSKVVVAG
ncbi:MAG: nucleotide exchange factor GrpE [Rhodothermales bacterium]|nr:nucleotide exchange factor GrpE [Rhodothermales bacterium]